MSSEELLNNIDKDNDCTKQFRKAYENRYTWEPGFSGYKGICEVDNEYGKYAGSFVLPKDCKPIIKGLSNKEAEKDIYSQLWEVSIHRIRRPFEKTHGQNTFKSGEINSTGLEILVDGKNKGDKYRIKDNTVTMVYRHIHGSLINIFTEKVFYTPKGYLSQVYTSQNLDPITKKPSSAKRTFIDEFTPLRECSTFVLSSRTIEAQSFLNQKALKTCYKFNNLEKL
ncbi:MULTISPECIES: DUF3386 domain-containing protein [Prochlorococcus]|uniref:DUF3386 domain-containing protein n=1 Tax=Prochlorococcus TaxID=1218 RepID=UPI000533B3B0|nr:MULTISPECIES: DUF3386 domain-containing protein [Prochlorococcus]KGG12172.1 hypothetical protein EV05_1377 [Prochlorococcus sp. MIT 0601]